MLFYLYLASVAISVLSLHFIVAFFSFKLKRDKIKIIENYSFFEEIKFNSIIVFKLILPIFNLLYISYLIIFHSFVYQKLVTNLFLQGNAMFLSKEVEKNMY